jgi:hypothetical protein
MYDSKRQQFISASAIVTEKQERKKTRERERENLQHLFKSKKEK